MFHFASKGGYYLSAAFIQERPLIEHIRYLVALTVPVVVPAAVGSVLPDKSSLVSAPVLITIL